MYILTELIVSIFSAGRSYLTVLSGKWCSRALSSFCSNRCAKRDSFQLSTTTATANSANSDAANEFHCTLSTRFRWHTIQSSTSTLPTSFQWHAKHITDNTIPTGCKRRSISSDKFHAGTLPIKLIPRDATNIQQPNRPQHRSNFASQPANLLSSGWQRSLSEAARLQSHIRHLDIFFALLIFSFPPDTHD